MARLPSRADSRSERPAAAGAVDIARRLRWAHGEAELQARGAMLAPVVFRAAGHPDFAPLQVAPWAEEPGVERWPGLLGRLRGEWPCVPFGRCDRPEGLPGDWASIEPDDEWGHGFASHHEWQWVDERNEGGVRGPQVLRLHIEPPNDPVVRCLTRTVRPVADAPSLDIELRIDAHRAGILPVALHPTLRLDLGRVELELAHDGPGFSYPVPAEPGRSRLAPNVRFDRLDAVPLAAGGQADLSRYPQPADSEELLQLTALRGPVTAHYLDAGWSLTLDWDRTLLPDLMLWVSHRGRLHEPWNGRHLALGLEPVCGPWDLGRVTRLPPDHPLAGHRGIELAPDAPCVIRYRLTAHPHRPTVSAPGSSRQPAEARPTPEHPQANPPAPARAAVRKEER